MLNNNALISHFELADFLYQDGTKTLNQDTMEIAINAASDRCESYTQRNFKLEKADQYFDGSGTSTFYFPDFPVQTVHTLQQDIDRNFTSSSNISSDDFVVYNEDGHLELYNNESAFSIGKKNVHVVYRSGFNMTEFESDSNALSFVIDSATLGVTFTATKFPSNQSYINHINSKFSAATGNVTVKYNNRAEEFEFTSSTATTFQILFENSSANYHFGFFTDQTGSTNYTSEYQTPFIPADLRQSIVLQSAWWYKQNFGKGDGMLGIRQTSISSVSQSVADPILKILPEVKMIWDNYKAYQCK